jgi:hypothetical protein
MRPEIVETKCIKIRPGNYLGINDFHDFTPISPLHHRSSIYTRSPFGVNK